MYRYFIVLSYKGTSFHGWQLQENAITVQSEIEYCLRLLLKDEIRITGCGRTDTGVHARAYVAHFDYGKKMNPDDLLKLIRKMNMFLSDSIVLHTIREVNIEQHARFCAIERTYKYFISRTKNPFLKDFVFEYSLDLNIRLMQLACKVIKQYEDFTSFSKTGGNSKSNICKLRYATWEYDEISKILVFTICADRFLRNMVRAIVGTMLDVGREKLGLDDLRKIIESRKRPVAGASIEAKGLFLWDVKYEGIEYNIPSMLFLPHTFETQE